MPLGTESNSWSITLETKPKLVPVAILGPTGCIGETLYNLLSDSSRFEVTTVIGSDKRLGTSFQHLPFSSIDHKYDVSLIFSCIGGEKSKEIEWELANRGYGIISTGSAHRWTENVPIVIPEVNSHHLAAIANQPFNKGFIVTKPNCSVAGIVFALKPLMQRYHISKSYITTLQAISGAGKYGLTAWDIHDNIIPYIEGEEEKIEQETKKILDHETLQIHAMATRVPVRHGHTAVVVLESLDPFVMDEVKNLWNNFPFVRYVENLSSPQPREDLTYERGMGVTIGRLKQTTSHSITFVVVSHNLIRGGAGGAIALAELLVKKNYVKM